VLGFLFLARQKLAHFQPDFLFSLDGWKLSRSREREERLTGKMAQ
jgi:hypothetical protein